MNDNFDLLRNAVKQCFENLGASPNDDLIEFRNAANLSTIQELLSAYDRLNDKRAEVAAVHSAGVLNADELDVLDNFRKADAQGKGSIAISASVAAMISAEYATRTRCEVVDISNKRPG